MRIARHISVLLLALVGVSSAAVERHSPNRGRHLAAAVVHRDLGDIISSIGEMLGGGDSSTTGSTTTTDDDSSTSVSDTTTTTTDDDTTSLPTTLPTTTTDPPKSTTSPDEDHSTTPEPTSSACTPIVLLGIEIPCGDEPTSSSLAPEPTISSSSGTITDGEPEPTDTTTTTTSDEPPSTTDEPTTTSDEPPASTEEPTTTSDEPSTTTEPPPEECTPKVLAGITISACETTTTTTEPEPTEDPTTTSDDDDGPTGSPTSTQTQGPDPCDPSLLDPILGGVLPGWCTPGGTSTQPPATTTTDEPNNPPTTTWTPPPDTDSPDPGPTTSTETTATFTPPNPFPPDPDTDDDEPTWSTTSTRTDGNGPDYTVPPFLTQTSSLGLDELPTTTAVPTETDPDAAPSVTAPESQTVPTPGVTQLPDNLPAYIMASNAPNRVPSGTTLITLMFGPQLNWGFVATDEETALQLMTYAPVMIMNALKIEQNQVPMLALQAFLPNNWDGKAKSLLTLAQMYIPTGLVPDLANQLNAVNSPFYNNQRESITRQLVLQVVPSYPLTASSGSNGGGGPDGSPAGGNLGGLLDNGGGSSADESRKRAIIGVCAAIGGALLVGAVWWAYKNHQRRRELAHRRLSQNSDTQFAAAGGLVPDYGAGGAMAERGRRDSFFFAADSLRGYEDGRFQDEGETYDHRSIGMTSGGALSARGGPGSNSGHGHGSPTGYGQPIQPGAISQPILRENTLNW